MVHLHKEINSFLQPVKHQKNTWSYVTLTANNNLIKWFMVQNLKIADKKLISKLFVRHSSGDKRRNEGKKSSIDFFIKLNEDDWMFEKDVKTGDQGKIFKLLTNSFWGINLACII